MKSVLLILPFLLAVPTLAQVQDTRCHGTIHGVVTAHDGRPVSGLSIVLWPVGIDIDLVLPRLETNARGEYRFEQICAGRYTVLAEDKKASYPVAFPTLNRFLYGIDDAEVKINSEQQMVELRVDLPPKPGQLTLSEVRGQTDAIVARADIELKVSRHRWIRLVCGDSSPCTGLDFPVPPNHDVRLRVNSRGFHKWDRLIHVAPGNALTLDVELDSIQN